MEVKVPSLILAPTLHENTKKEQKRKSPHVWVKQWQRNRSSTSEFGNIFSEFRLHDEEEFRRYLRMEHRNFL